MKHKFFVLAWLFIFLAAAYDARFAWQNREFFLSWEENPVARWAVAQFGLLAFIACKFSGLGFAVAMAIYCKTRRLNRLELPLTAIVLCVYASLSLHYVVNIHHPNTPPALFRAASQ